MIRVQSRPWRTAAAVVAALGLFGTACGSSGGVSAKGAVKESTTTSTTPKGPDSTAATLRSKLAGLFGEHVYLASAATGAALGGRADEFAAASAALDGNSNALTDNFTAIFDATTGKTFDGLWKKHVGLFVAYAQGLAAHDGGKSAQAVSDLNTYAKDFGTFINSVLPSLPADSVTGLVSTHIQTLKAVVDAQAGSDENAVFTAERAAVAHMATVAAGLAGAIAKKNPDKISGDPASKAADFVAKLNDALREHVFLAASATEALLAGRTAEFNAASSAVGTVTGDLAGLLSSVYGPEAANTFTPLWKNHIGLIVDYATAAGAKDQAKADAAVDKLLAWTADFGDFVSKASPKLTADSVGELAKTYVLTLKDLIDAQVA
ncbi:MAG TPA: hypothetical protein VHL53_21485, partial [Acidimicrobiia bacterium]|nr:hypothetical protein [Acidimicrobiia bacterium]